MRQRDGRAADEGHRPPYPQRIGAGGGEAVSQFPARGLRLRGQGREVRRATGARQKAELGSEALPEGGASALDDDGDPASTAKDSGGTLEE